MSTLSRLISKILLRTDTVDNVLRVFEKTQQKLVTLSEQLRALAVENEAKAQAALDKAKQQSAEAERATSVANKISDLTK